MGSVAFERVQEFQRSCYPGTPLRFATDGRWLIFGHSTATLYSVEITHDGLFKVEIGGERENPSLDFITNDRHAVDMFVFLACDDGFFSRKRLAPEPDVSVTLTIDQEKRTQRLVWPGGWAEGPTASGITERGHVLPRLALFITQSVKEVKVALDSANMFNPTTAVQDH